MSHNACVSAIRTSVSILRSKSAVFLAGMAMPEAERGLSLCNCLSLQVEQIRLARKGLDTSKSKSLCGRLS